MDYICTNFSVDSSGRFSFRVQMDKHTHTYKTDAADHSTLFDASATADVA